ncbi:MAG: alpha/beta fold hydrolase [Desulfomonile sp.]|nr:prolyl oligopeptidase family serine peptidase [Deltaproteobacteria bacterium]
MESNIIGIMFKRLVEALRIKTTVQAADRVGTPGIYTKQPFTVEVDGIKIRGTVFFPSSHPAKQYPALIICHGIPGRGTARPQNDPGYEVLARQFLSCGMAAVIFNFRGCGDSGGDFDILGWTRDLEAVIDKTLNTPYIDPTRIMVLGFSGGGAAAIYVGASNSMIYSMAVVGTPANFRLFEKDPDEIINDFKDRGLFRSPDFPVNIQKWINGFEEIEPSRWVTHFRGKHLLIVHGDADELVPVSHAREIFERAPAGIAQLDIIPGGVHRLRLDERCVEILEKWFVGTIGWKL